MSYLQDIETFKDEIPTIFEEKMAELLPQRHFVDNFYQARMDVAWENFLAKNKGKNRAVTNLLWDEESKLANYPIAVRLAELEAEIANIRKAKRTLDALLDGKVLDIEAARKVPIESLYEGRLRGRERLCGLCPFHEEKTPSFYIFTDTNTFHCFGCQAHGSVIDFVMLKEGVDFKKAVKSLI